MYQEKHRYDVCVVGGGMAGMCAAIAAARNGAKTLIVQDRPVFGGNASSEIRMWICGAHGHNLKETGILEEIQLENCYQNPAGNYSIWDAVLYSKVRFQPGLDVLLNCSCTGCEVEEERIREIKAWQLTTQTWHHIEADIFIDCSGDSILASSGAAFRQGREPRSEFDEDIQGPEADDKTMGNTILIQLRRTDEPQPFTGFSWAYQFNSPEDFPFRLNGVKGGNWWWIELGGLDHTIKDAEKIRDELLKCSWGIWDYIKNRAPEKDEAENWALEWLGSLPGKRENRRFEGPLILNQNHVRAGGEFEDTIAYGGWTMDDHHPAGFLYPGKPTVFHPAPSPYGIPYRSIYSRNIKNLMFAGRNISVTHAALSSTRVMATCALIGQAAGTAAAIAVNADILPDNLYPAKISDLQQALMDDDCFLPGFQRSCDPLAEAGKTANRLIVDGHERSFENDEHHLSCSAGDAIEWHWDEEVNLEGLRLSFDSNLNDTKRMPCSYPVKRKGPALPKFLCKAYRVEMQDKDGNWQTVHQEENNYQRLNVLALKGQTKGLRFIPEASWGGSDCRVFSFEPLSECDVKMPPVPEGLAWQQVMAQVDPKDIEPPANTGEGAKEKGLSA